MAGHLCAGPYHVGGVFCLIWCLPVRNVFLWNLAGLPLEESNSTFWRLCGFDRCYAGHVRFLYSAGNSLD